RRPVWLGRERSQQLLVRALRMRIDELDDAANAVRNRRGLQIQEKRPRDRHVGNGLVHLEELQSTSRKLLTQYRGHLQRKPSLLLPTLAQQPHQAPVAQIAAGRARRPMRL